MNYTLTDIDEVTKEIKFSFEPGKIEAAYQKGLKAQSAKIEIPGFRVGKAPAAIIEAKYGQQLRAEARESYISDLISETLQEANLDVIGDIETKDLSESGVTLVVYTRPIFELPKYDAFTVQTPAIEVAPAEIDAELEKMRYMSAKKEKPSFREKIREGDIVDVKVTYVKDFEGKEIDINSKASQSESESGGGQTFSIALSAHAPTPASKEFIEFFLNKAVGDLVEMPRAYTIQTGYQLPEGKEDLSVAKYEVLSFVEPVLSELNDSWVAGLNGKLKTILELRMTLGDAMKEQKTSLSRSTALDKVIGQLMESTQVTLPANLVRAERRNLLRAAFTRQGFPKEQLDTINFDLIPETPDNASFTQQAKKNIKMMLILSRIAEAEALTIEREDLETEFMQYAKDEKSFRDVVTAYEKNERFRDTLNFAILQRKACNFLLDRTKIEPEVPAAA